MFKTTVFSLEAPDLQLSIELVNGRESNYYHLCNVKMAKGKEQHRNTLQMPSFKDCFERVNSMAWHRMKVTHLAIAHRAEVLKKLLQKLNDSPLLEEAPWPGMESLENWLDCQLVLEPRKVNKGLQQITIHNLVQFCEFEHDVLRPAKLQEQVVRKAQWAVMLNHHQAVRHEGVELLPNLVEPKVVLGFLHVEGGAIVVRNGEGQITHVCSHQHFSATAEPATVPTQHWVAIPAR